MSRFYVHAKVYVGRGGCYKALLLGRFENLIVLVDRSTAIFIMQPGMCPVVFYNAGGKGSTQGDQIRQMGNLFFRAVYSKNTGKALIFG
jgi:hypothetical protein